MLHGPPGAPFTHPGTRRGYGGGVTQVGRKLAGSKDGRTLPEVPGVEQRRVLAVFLLSGIPHFRSSVRQEILHRQGLVHHLGRYEIAAGNGRETGLFFYSDAGGGGKTLPYKSPRGGTAVFVRGERLLFRCKGNIRVMAVELVGRGGRFPVPLFFALKARI